ncbi:TPA: carboxypeptidase regulatory-like domain-containing protein [Candidatus Woesearchaeota archaeon]|nr:carboxypeptidase regulatory-like domain-containing protein [Candidatus Woesearchaeota archaeon]
MNEIKSGCRCSYSLIVLLIFGLIFLPLALAQGGEIKGKILPSDSNATIYVISPTQEIAGIDTISINGEYSFRLPIGIYNLFIRARGEYDNKTIFQIGVRENETIKLQDITLSRFNETGSISGYVNPPIADLKVEVKKFGGGEGGFSITSDKGYYEVKDLEPDTYGIFVRFNSTQNFYDYKWSMIDIYANSSLTGINLTFTPKNSKYLIDRIIVEFQPAISESEKREIISSFDSRIMSHYSYSRHYVVNVPYGQTSQNRVDLFKTNPNVKDAYLDGIAHTISGNEPVEEIQNNEDSAPIEELQEKTKQIKEIVEKIESTNNNGENIKLPNKNSVSEKDLDNSKKISTFYAILILVILTIIFTISYLMLKWKKRV